MKICLPLAAIVLAATVGCDGSLTRDLLVRYQPQDPTLSSSNDIVLDPRPLPAVTDTIDSIAAAHQMPLEGYEKDGMPFWCKSVVLPGGVGSSLGIGLKVVGDGRLRVTVSLFLAGRESPEMTALLDELTVALHAKSD